MAFVPDAVFCQRGSTIAGGPIGAAGAGGISGSAGTAGGTTGAVVAGGISGSAGTAGTTGRAGTGGAGLGARCSPVSSATIWATVTCTAGVVVTISLSPSILT